MENGNNPHSTVIKATTKTAPEPTNRDKFESDSLIRNDSVIKNIEKQKSKSLIRNAPLLDESSINASSTQTSATVQDNSICTIEQNQSDTSHLKLAESEKETGPPSSKKG